MVNRQRVGQPVRPCCDIHSSPHQAVGFCPCREGGEDLWLLNKGIDQGSPGDHMARVLADVLSRERIEDLFQISDSDGGFAELFLHSVADSGSWPEPLLPGEDANTSALEKSYLGTEL